MKDLIALLTFVCLAITTIYLATTKRIDHKLTCIFLIFAIVAPISIANYDIIKKFKWGDVEVETAKREIVEAKDSALKEMSSEIRVQREALNNLVNTASDLQNKIQGQKKEIIKLNESAENTKKSIEKLNAAANKIALIHVRTVYFTMQTKSEFGTDRARKAIQEVQNDLNAILPIVIPDANERSKWVEKLQNTLPPNK